MQPLPQETAGLTSQAKAKEGRVVQEQHRQQHWESVTRRRPTDKAYATPELAIFVSSGLLRLRSFNATASRRIFKNDGADNSRDRNRR